MKRLLIKFCTWYLAREYRQRERKDIKNQAILNKFREQNIQQIAGKHDIPVEKVKSLQTNVN
ncbi:hypothetical protein [Aggregatibacter actinomycetemcomitans]|uniref:hypothetical protein n=1 Tax=Aggregatibacter actinomycetemcomitans TaxID=714 RepID=UPI001E37A8F9|nr:hypothetical protein [Aggregatibacter actinomycetemcomitans]